MESISVKKSIDETKQITALEIGGMLVLENSDELKTRLIEACQKLNKKIVVTIKDVIDIDISCIQLILAFINYLDDNHISYAFDWHLDEDQSVLLENVGFSNELFLN